jgi:hypothetical protein
MEGGTTFSKRKETLEKFSSVHAQVHNHFNQERHLVKSVPILSDKPAKANTAGTAREFALTTPGQAYSP